MNFQLTTPSLASITMKIFCSYAVWVRKQSVGAVIGADFRRAMVASASGRTTSHKVPPYEELDLRHEFAHLFSGKSIKTAATRAALFDSSMHQIVCRLGLRPRPRWGSLQRSPDSLAGKGPYF